MTRCIGEVAAVSLVAGVVYAAVHPPMLTSTAAVVLAQPVKGAQAATSNGAPEPYTATQEVMASSKPVLAAALPHVRPAMSLAELRGDVQIRGMTPYVITVSAKGRVAADVEATANAVVRSYILYMNSAGGPVVPVEALMLESAANAHRKVAARQPADYWRVQCVVWGGCRSHRCASVRLGRPPFPDQPVSPRTFSLGICATWPVARPDLGSGCP
jgi:hypothetical protein